VVFSIVVFSYWLWKSESFAKQGLHIYKQVKFEKSVPSFQKKRIFFEKSFFRTCKQSCLHIYKQVKFEKSVPTFEKNRTFFKKNFFTGNGSVIALMPVPYIDIGNNTIALRIAGNAIKTLLEYAGSYASSRYCQA
jgi:hypothetical protein